MNKITFVNGQSPALNANNMNLLQTNTENAIATAKSEAISSASSDATTKDNAVLSTLRGEISTAQSNAVGTAQTYTDNKVKNATLTIKKNNSTVATFTANASSNVSANITVPTNTNELTNGAGFQTSSDVTTALNNKIKYGTSLPSSADNGTIFILYS